tara:strand:+ start:3875 stop:4408 length:534 start_codon:yes stop_codon:yes gene_type:complete
VAPRARIHAAARAPPREGARDARDGVRGARNTRIARVGDDVKMIVTTLERARGGSTSSRDPSRTVFRDRRRIPRIPAAARPDVGRSAPHTRAHGIARDRTRARASPERRATNDDARRFSSLDGVDRVERASTATRRRRPTRREASIADSFAKGDESESRRARASSARARRGRARWRR